MSIAADKIEQFHTDGYFVLDSVIPDELLTLLRSACQSATERMDAKMDARGTDVIGINHRAQRYFIGSAASTFPDLRQFVFSDLMASTCRAILGETVYFKSDQFVVKYGKTSMEFAWHQDSGYVQRRIGDHPEILSCWCALDDVSEANGTVYILPMRRYGEKRVVDHTQMEGTNDLVGYFGDDPGEPVIMSAGGMAVFSGMTFHRSGANPTGRPRRVYLAQYTAAPMPGDDQADANELFIQDGRIVDTHRDPA